MDPRRRAHLMALGLCVAVVPLISACGEEDFANEPRPPSPIEVTASINDGEVSVSPSEVGAGLVNITVANLSGEVATLTLDGPTEVASDDIQPGGTAAIKTTLEEGTYEASAGAEPGVESDTIDVGPERESSSNELLLP